MTDSDLDRHPENNRLNQVVDLSDLESQDLDADEADVNKKKAIEDVMSFAEDSNELPDPEGEYVSQASEVEAATRNELKMKAALEPTIEINEDSDELPEVACGDQKRPREEDDWGESPVRAAGKRPRRIESDEEDDGAVGNDAEDVAQDEAKAVEQDEAKAVEHDEARAMELELQDDVGWSQFSARDFDTAMASCTLAPVSPRADPKPMAEGPPPREGQEPSPGRATADGQERLSSGSGELELPTTQEALAAMAAAERTASQARLSMDDGLAVLGSQRFLLERSKAREGLKEEGIETEAIDLPSHDPEMEAMQAAEPEEERRTIPDSDEDLFSQSQPGTPRGPELPTIPEEPEVVDTSEWRFVLSNLTAWGKGAVPGWVAGLGCRGVQPRVGASVTHVVVRTDDALMAARTLKYLQAVASGLLVVSERWVAACLKDPAGLSDALRWEARDEELEGEGPRRAREARQAGAGLLLAGFEVLVEGEMEGLDRAGVEDLLARAGARSVTSIEGFTFGPEVVRLALVDSMEELEKVQVAAARRLRAYKVATIEKDWLLDSICGHEVKSISGGSVMDMSAKLWSVSGVLKDYACRG